MKRWVATVLFSLLLVEVVVRVALRAPDMPDRLDGACRCDVGRELGWYVSRLASGGLVGFVHDPDLGWAPRPGELGVNAQGTRDGRPVPSPSADRKRLVVIGDSFAWGDDLDVADSLGQQLERRLVGWDVFNLAVPGYGHDQAVLRYEREGAALHPDAVLLVYVALDVVRNGAHFFSAAKPWFEPGPDGLEVRGVPVPEPTAKGWQIFLRPWTLDLVRVYRIGLSRNDPWRDDRDVALTGSILDRFAVGAQQAGVIPVVIDAPTPQDVRAAGTPAPGLLPGTRLMDTWCEGRDHPCGSVWDAVLASAPDDATFRKGSHWSAAGTAEVAEAMVAWLVEHGVVTPQEVR